MASATEKQVGHIPTLDGWRAVAVVWVMIYHSRGHLSSTPFMRLADCGYIGVNIFFGLSGLLICWRLIREREKAGSIDVYDFYLRRGFRILPPYLSYLLVLLILALAGLASLTAGEFVSCLVFMRNYVEPDMGYGYYTSHFWSLAVEEHFYLLWPVLLITFFRLGRPKTATLGLALLVAAWRTVDARYGLFDRTFGIHTAGNVYRSDTAISSLLFGCGVAMFLSDPRWRKRLEGWLSPPAWALLTALFLAIAIFGKHIPFARLLMDLLVPLLLAGTLLHPTALAGRFLEWAPVRWIGRLSYSLYIWQQLFLLPRSDTYPLGVLQSFPVNWIASLLCAIGSYHLIEQPAIALGRRVSKARKARAAIAAEAATTLRTVSG
jgi:peptidoglycan/LPS O-acetylase OafA/YrhL